MNAGRRACAGILLMTRTPSSYTLPENVLCMIIRRPFLLIVGARTYGPIIW